jgi:hypothetical protein
MPNYSYTKQWENPQQKLDAIRKKRGKIDSSPVFFGYWAEAAPYKVVLADYEEGLHSLIQENTCTCGLRIGKSDNLLAIIESKHHRNHKTLEPEPTPKFRGLVGKRIAVANIGGNDMHPVDELWNRTVWTVAESNQGNKGRERLP